jgi:endonuclease/exonuclease/phosphatase family metal-dependent hydrolase
MRLRLGLLWLALVVCAGAETLRVSTFNVRYPAKTDGANVWKNRRDLLVDTIREKDPDFFGTQELFYEQGEYIGAMLPQYTWFGVSRRGNREDEHMGVFYKRARLRPVESGNFWLSETPEAPGSMSWEVSLPRMVTWALLEIQGSGKRFYHFNTHFPHRRKDEAARLNCAKVIAGRLEKLPKDVPLILTGDFNAAAGGEVYQVFAGALEDAWVTAAKRSGPECTLSGFKGNTTGPRIDWIFYRGRLKALEAETVTRNQDGRYPSDHYPVWAVLELW